MGQAAIQQTSTVLHLCSTSAKDAECREGSQAMAHNGSVSPADIPDEEQDADIDLLQWSSALDFDNYTR